MYGKDYAKTCSESYLERERERKSNSLKNQEKLTAPFCLERNAFEEIDICFVGGHLC